MKFLQKRILGHVYLCLNCSKPLQFRTIVGIKFDPITCTNCGIKYSRTFVLEAHPRLWDYVRNNKLFEVDEANNLRLKVGVGLHPKLEKTKEITRGTSESRG